MLRGRYRGPAPRIRSAVVSGLGSRARRAVDVGGGPVIGAGWGEPRGRAVIGRTLGGPVANTRGRGDFRSEPSILCRSSGEGDRGFRKHGDLASSCDLQSLPRSFPWWVKHPRRVGRRGREAAPTRLCGGSCVSRAMLASRPCTTRVRVADPSQAAPGGRGEGQSRGAPTRVSVARGSRLGPRLQILTHSAEGRNTIRFGGDAMASRAMRVRRRALCLRLTSMTTTWPAAATVLAARISRRSVRSDDLTGSGVAFPMARGDDGRNWIA